MFGVYATRVEPLRSCDTSFFKLVDRVWRRSLTPAEPFHRFCSWMRLLKARTYLEERLVPNDEILYEQSAAATRLRRPVKLTATRFTFFSVDPGTREWRDKTRLVDGDLVGYAVVVHLAVRGRPTRRYVLEAVVAQPAGGLSDGGRGEPPPFTRAPNFFVHCVQSFVTTIGAAGEGKHRDLTLTGTFFTQQNDVTSVCAHAALRIAINSSTLATGRKLTNQDINDALGLTFRDPHTWIGSHDNGGGRGSAGLAPARCSGLTGQEIERVVRAWGSSTIVADFRKNVEVEYDHFVYPFVESGYPVILGLDGVDANTGRPVQHVVSALGHTFNTQRWWPEARVGYGTLPERPYIPAVEWTDHFVISDDGYGMNQTLQTDVVRNLLVPAKNSSLHASLAMALVPDEVTWAGLSAEEVAAASTTNLLATHDGTSYYYSLLKRGTLVCRTLLQSRQEYVDRLRRQLPKGARFTAFQERKLRGLPRLFWLTEITLPQLYATNQKKLGDVLTRVDVKPEEGPEKAFRSIVLTWLPGLVRFGGGPVDNDWPITSPCVIVRGLGV